MSERHPLWGQLPEPIQRLLDNEDPADPWDPAAPHVTEYLYTTVLPSGKRGDTSLGCECSYNPDPLPEAGSVISVNGVRVRVMWAEESTEEVETPQFTGTRIWRDINVRELDG
ncbi:hypothetical protein [Streptomyces sp. 5-10]|uniref:hypothetical protein n=1 Tax=Streptomyces sp. 5-10 TaxID=878925 RepID=UPI00168ADF5F|nr:hypothetical protein [Streptomyces sp. 5-10]MBD3004757.1 hypothetical protein [Streptomyces sp. 5-10]